MKPTQGKKKINRGPHTGGPEPFKYPVAPGPNPRPRGPHTGGPDPEGPIIRGPRPI